MKKTLENAKKTIQEIRVRFKYSIVELKKGLFNYEIELICQKLNIVEEYLFWAINNYSNYRKKESQNQISHVL